MMTMGKVKQLFDLLRERWYVKYILVCVIGLLIVGVLDENSLWAHYRNKQHIKELESEIEAYESAFNRDQAKIRDLQHNPKAIEKIARERYFMKMADEDVFVMREGEAVETPDSESKE